MNIDEKEIINRVGKDIGFGRMMHLAQECWRETLVEQG